jgi:hypothetical protein
MKSKINSIFVFHQFKNENKIENAITTLILMRVSPNTLNQQEKIK